MDKVGEEDILMNLTSGKIIYVHLVPAAAAGCITFGTGRHRKVLIFTYI